MCCLVLGVGVPVVVGDEEDFFDGVGVGVECRPLRRGERRFVEDGLSRRPMMSTIFVEWLLFDNVFKSKGELDWASLPFPSLRRDCKIAES